MDYRSAAFVLANIVGPVTFLVDPQSGYSIAGLPWLEDLYLIIVAVITTVLIVRCNAGHEYPAICSNGRFELLKDKHGFVLGGMAGSKYREYTIRLKKGDKIFVYTDGVPEATNAEEAMLGTEGMMRVLNKNAKASPEEVINTIRKAVNDFMNGADQFDDVTMLCLKYNGN